MYPGWLLSGHGDPFVGEPFNEIVNNARAYAYAAYHGLGWLQSCSDCPESGVLLPNSSNFTSPTIDPAPWYDSENPDSWGFLGVVGLDVEGSESSTMQASVTMALTGGGVIGPAYHGPRTLTVRALLIAQDECSLQFGLNWVRDIAGTTSADSCTGESLTYLDCCPCSCGDDTPAGPCWADDYFEFRTNPPCVGSGEGPIGAGEWVETYGELRDTSPDLRLWPTWPDTYTELNGTPAGALCWPDFYIGVKEGPVGCPPPPTAPPPTGDDVWWPDTYAEVIAGPPTDVVWCNWPTIYQQLRHGPPDWSCCAQQCVVPYIRQYHNVRVTEGPTVLNHPSMFSCGAMCEIELVLVAADPVEQSMAASRGAFEFTDPVDVDDEPPLPPPPDPFDVPGVTTMRGLALLTRPQAALTGGPARTEWTRVSRTVATGDNVLSTQAPLISLRTFADAAEDVRVGVWMGGARLCGWYVPFIPAWSVVNIDGPNRQLYASMNGGSRPLTTFIQDWAGGPATFPRLPHGPFIITVDQRRDGDVRLLTTVATTGVGATG